MSWGRNCGAETRRWISDSVCWELTASLIELSTGVADYVRVYLFLNGWYAFQEFGLCIQPEDANPRYRPNSMDHDIIYASGHRISLNSRWRFKHTKWPWWLSKAPFRSSHWHLKTKIFTCSTVCQGLDHIPTDFTWAVTWCQRRDESWCKAQGWCRGDY